MAIQIVGVTATKAVYSDFLAGLTVKVQGARPGSQLQVELVRIERVSYREYQPIHAYNVGVVKADADGRATLTIPAANNSIVRRLNLLVDGQIAVRITRIVGDQLRVEAVRPTLYSRPRNKLWEFSNRGWEDRGYYRPDIFQAPVTIG